MSESDLFAPQSSSTNIQLDQPSGPYPPLQRACYVCGEQAWSWNGERYVCAGSARSVQAHANYEQFSAELRQRYYDGHEA